MRTKVSQEQLAAIVTKFFEDAGAGVNFMHFGEGVEGGVGVLVDHDGAVELPEGGG